MAQRSKNVVIEVDKGTSQGPCYEIGQCLECPACNTCFRIPRQCHNSLLEKRPKKRDHPHCSLLEYVLCCRIPYAFCCWLPVGLTGTLTAGRRETGKLTCCDVRFGLGCLSKSTCWCITNAVLCPACVAVHGITETNPCADCYTAEEVMASSNYEDASLPFSFINNKDNVTISKMANPEVNTF